MSYATVIPEFVLRQSFIELDARARAQSLMDPGSWRELVGPFDRIESPWLPEQGIAPQFDDGCVVLKGAIAGKATVVIALEGGFQAGSMGEVSGAKMTAALDLATRAVSYTHLIAGWRTFFRRTAINVFPRISNF